MTERPSPSESSTPGGPDPAAPGLGKQFGRTRDALLGLVAAHFKLLSAELSEIMDEVKRALALGGVAAVLLLLAGLLVFVGTILWLDEWVFGSIGWGVVHGGTLLIAIAVTLALLIIPNSAPRIGLAFFVAALVAIAFGLILWLELSSRAWGAVGSNFMANLTWFDGHAVSDADRPIAAGVIVLGVLFGVLGLIGGLVAGSGIGGRIGLAIALGIAGAIVGGLIGALLGVPISWGCSIAVALALFLILHSILACVFVLPSADWDALKKRLIPSQTIDTTKETIEWVRAQMPLGRKS